MGTCLYCRSDFSRLVLVSNDKPVVSIIDKGKGPLIWRQRFYELETGGEDIAWADAQGVELSTFLQDATPVQTACVRCFDRSALEMINPIPPRDIAGHKRLIKTIEGQNQIANNLGLMCYQYQKQINDQIALMAEQGGLDGGEET